MAKPVSEKIKLGEDEFCIHTWNKDLTEPKAVVVIYHGFLAHGLYPTVRYAAEILAAASDASYKVISADMRGHGQSSGLVGFFPSVEVLLEDATRVAEYAMAQQQSNDPTKRPKLFLLGSSMGGTIALEVARKMADKVAGVLLLAPMLKLKVSGLEQTLLSGVAAVFPTWSIIPSSSTNASVQYRDETKRIECENDPYTPNGKTIRAGSANTCVSLASRVEFGKVQIPFWVGVAEQDVVVDKQGCLDLYEKSPSTDKMMKRYEALHGLLCEPSPLFDEISKDILDWVQKRL